ncbi:hypothetical protein F511_33028 [Dorcoceras hygrometricum]|uniref:CCHC-type domain-containing protein n=1 Tax=Dorcoceras hygrometricum TaxID=472368 RepID=A0A2Z7CC48_9LAMI|nr:hypothetical protein F511_33028 [Dorcoceras hygrometricum]
MELERISSAGSYSGIESAESFNQQLVFGVGDCKTMSHSAGRLCVDYFSSRKLQWIQSQCKDFQTQCLKNQSQVTSWKHMFNTSWTTRRKQQQHPVVIMVSQLVVELIQMTVPREYGHHRFRPRGRQFKKKSGSSSSGSGSSSSSSPRAEFCGQCVGKHPTTQCVGVEGACNNFGQYGHFARVCPLDGSQHTADPPQGRSGGSGRGRSFPVQQPRMGETQPHFSGPQHA